MEITDRQSLIDRYAAGPAALKAAYEEAPFESLKWKPSSLYWSIHEIIIHCADSEAYAGIRIRLLAAETSPMTVGYDQELWVRALHYHDRPVNPAFALIESVRASTAEVIRSLDLNVWSSVGTHTESGDYSADDWLATYSVHHHDHADQIRSNVERWKSIGASR